MNWRKLLSDYNTRVPTGGQYAPLLAEMMWRLGHTSTCVGVPPRCWRDVAFWRLLASISQVGQTLPQCADLDARGLYVPRPTSVTLFEQLPCSIRHGENSQIVFTSAQVMALHRFPPADCVSDEVAATLFQHDPVIDQPDPAEEAAAPAAGRGRGRPRGRGGSFRGVRGVRGVGRSRRRGRRGRAGAPAAAPPSADAAAAQPPADAAAAAPPSADAAAAQPPAGGDDELIPAGRAQARRAKLKTNMDRLAVGQALEIPHLTMQMRQMARDAAASIRPGAGSKLITWCTGVWPNRTFHVFKPTFVGEVLPSMPADVASGGAAAAPAAAVPSGGPPASLQVRTQPGRVMVGAVRLPPMPAEPVEEDHSQFEIPGDGRCFASCFLAASDPSWYRVPRHYGYAVDRARLLED